MERIPLRWNAKQVGVYCIRNKNNGKVYVGSSVSCYHRVKSQHFAKLRRGQHNNSHLQASWSKYGEKRFESFCLEICETKNLVCREQHWIELTGCLDRKLGYNINPYADRMEHTQEQKDKISRSLFGKSRKQGMPSGLTKIGNGKWNVLVTLKSRKFYLGTFTNYKDAVKAQKQSISRLQSGEEPDWKWLDSFRIKPKKIVQYNNRGKVVKEYDNVGDVARDGFSPNSVGRCCRGWCRTYKGYRWQYLGEKWEYRR